LYKIFLDILTYVNAIEVKFDPLKIWKLNYYKLKN